jgi:carboxymethylenebutenolidase
VLGGTGKLGAIGFCRGGGMVNFLAKRLPDLGAAVPFYGPAPAPTSVGAIRAAAPTRPRRQRRLRQQYLAAALKAGGKRYEAQRYPGTQHGFHNDTTPRYDANAAAQAWQRALDFLNRNLRG